VVEALDEVLPGETARVELFAACTEEDLAVEVGKRRVPGGMVSGSGSGSPW
jgi:hypothetical protein